MKKITQQFIAKTLNISSGFISEILSGKKRPSWSVAKRLAEVPRRVDGSPTRNSATDHQQHDGEETMKSKCSNSKSHLQ